MDPTKAAVLAVLTMLGLVVLAQGEGARATAVSLRPRQAAEASAADVRCANVRADDAKGSADKRNTEKQHP